MTAAEKLWAGLRALMPQPLPYRFPTDTVVLFAPRDNLPAALQLLADGAQKAITLEMFTYCDATLDAILHAKAALPGFAFQATFDKSESTSLQSMATLIAGWQGDSRVIAGRSEHGAIIHRKICVFDHVFVASGSTNWTHAGEALEDNELVIRRSAVLASYYEQVLDANFQRLTAALPQPVTAA